MSNACGASVYGAALHPRDLAHGLLAFGPSTTHSCASYPSRVGSSTTRTPEGNLSTGSVRYTRTLGTSTASGALTRASNVLVFRHIKPHGLGVVSSDQTSREHLLIGVRPTGVSAVCELLKIPCHNVEAATGSPLPRSLPHMQELHCTVCSVLHIRDVLCTGWRMGEALSFTSCLRNVVPNDKC